MKSIFRILKSARELWHYYVIISVFTVLLSLMTLLLPLLSGWAIDEIRKGTGASVRYVALLAIGIFALDLGQNLFGNVSGYLGDQMSTRLNAILRTRYYEHIMSLPQRYFDTELTGKIINRLNRSIVQITSFMQMMSNNFLQFIFSTIFSLIAVAYYSWQVALMLFVLYPVYILMTYRSSSTWQDYQMKKNLHEDIATGRFAEAIGQIKVVKSFLQEKRELKIFTKQMNTIIATNTPQSKFWHIKDAQRRMVLSIIFFGVYMFVFVQGARGLLTPGQAVALILYAMQIRIPIFTISFLVENTQKAIADSKDYFEIMALKPTVADRIGAETLSVTNGVIRFVDVNFSYDKKQPVLKNINLNIEAATKVSLVGESGEGKTTLTNLLVRLYEPESGSILIDDQDISQVTQESLRRNIGVVFQEPALFSGTIKENIAYARPGATQKQVERAASDANAHEFISRFDMGYDTEIGERGLKLSGGQKQRIAIARALLKDAPILILDEATSSLDSKSEALVQEALERLMRGRTTIIIAHRLSTIQHVDQIITLTNGRVGEVGSPAQLARTKGIYAQLLELQKATKTESNRKKLQKFDLAS